MHRIVSFAILASVLAAFGLVIMAGPTFAQAGAKMNNDINAIAAAIKAGNIVGAKKLTVAAFKKFPDPDDQMAPFKKIAKGGLGVGGKDGIEFEIQKIAKSGIPAADLKARAADLEQMCDHTTAIAYVSELTGIPIPPKKGMPYSKLANDLVAASDAMKKAIAAQNPAGVQKAAQAVDQVCNTCHSIYR